MRCLTLSLTCHLMLFSAVAFCLEPTETVDAPRSALSESPSESSTSAAPSSPLVRESGPPIYYLKNQDGRLVPILGFRYEDFMEWFREKGQKDRDAAEPKPARFTIDRTTMTGTVEDGRANLDLRLQVTTREAGSIRVPIGLSQAIVRKDLKYEGEGSAFLDYDAEKKAYVVWIEGKKERKHDLSLSVTIATATIGLDTRLRFDAPRSTRSQMTLLIPQTSLDVHAPIESRLVIEEVSGVDADAGSAENALGADSDSAGKASAVEKSDQDQKKDQPKGERPTPHATRLTVDSVRGDFQLLWHKPPTGASEARTVMEASGEIIVTIGALEVTSEALLEVKGLGMPLDRFRIRLPKGTRTYHVSDGNYQVTELTPPEPGEKSASSQKNSPSSAPSPKPASEESRIIEVRLGKPTLEPVLIHVTTTRPLDQLATQTSIEPAGFEVIDAVRQWGHIATVVGPDHFVTWHPKRGIRRVDTLPGTMDVKKPSAVFEYYSTPFLLRSRVSPRRTRVSVEPEHLAHVGADQLGIESTLNYMIRGKSVLSLELDLGDWELDDVGPESLVDQAGIEVMPNGQVTVPLLRPTIGRARLTVTAHRTAPQQETDLKITFPSPQVDSPGPAVVVILPDDNVKLSPDATASTGLSRLQASPSIPLPTRQQLPLFYRGDAGQATFYATRSIHEQQISVDVQSTIVFEMLTAGIEQTFTYQIDHEPSNQIVLDVPAFLIQSADLEFLVDGTPVVPRVLSPSATGTTVEKEDATDSATLKSDTATDPSDPAPTPNPSADKNATTTAAEIPTSLPEERAVKRSAADASKSSKSPKAAKTESDDVLQTVPVVLTLKPAKIGQCVVAVRYRLQRRVLMPNTPIKRQIPLATAAVGSILHQELSVVSPLGLTAEVLEEQAVQSPRTPDSQDSTNGTAARNGLHANGAGNGSADHHGTPILEPIVDTVLSRSDLATGVRQDFKVTGRLGMITMAVSIEKRHEAPLVTIPRAFFQTWVTDTECQNRALFRFQTRQAQLLLTLPPGTVDRRIRLAVNGKSLLCEPLGEHRFLITLPDTQAGLQQLELRWSSLPPSDSRTLLNLGMPRLGDDGWIQRWYWQLLLPTGEHLLGTPPQLLSESIWKWSGGVFRREPTMKTGELESWVGTDVSTIEAPQANLYLFSSFGEPQSIPFRVANRAMIVLSASGLVLIAGFLLIYLPATRHPVSLLVLGVVLGSLGVIYPEPMLLALQASSVGVVLLGLTALLKRHMSRPQLPKPIPIAESGGSSILDRDSTQRQVILPPIAGRQETTETRLKPPPE